MRADPRKERARREEQTEATILSMLLDSHPVARTMPELVRVLEKDRDEINRALCALADYRLRTVGVRRREERDAAAVGGGAEFPETASRLGRGVQGRLGLRASRPTAFSLRLRLRPPVGPLGSSCVRLGSLKPIHDGRSTLSDRIVH